VSGKDGKVSRVCMIHSADSGPAWWPIVALVFLKQTFLLTSTWQRNMLMNRTFVKAHVSLNSIFCFRGMKNKILFRVADQVGICFVDSDHTFSHVLSLVYAYISIILFVV